MLQFVVRCRGITRINQIPQDDRDIRPNQLVELVDGPLEENV